MRHNFQLLILLWCHSGSAHRKRAPGMLARMKHARPIAFGGGGGGGRAASTLDHLTCGAARAQTLARSTLPRSKRPRSGCRP